MDISKIIEDEPTKTSSQEVVEALQRTSVEDECDEVVKYNQGEIQESLILDFALKTSDKMSELGILSLGITQNPREILMKTRNHSYRFSPYSGDAPEITPTSTTKLLSTRGLSGPAMKLGQALHKLLKNINKLPDPVPMMNPSKFEKPDSYNQVLLRKLERDRVSVSDDDDFLNVESQNTVDVNENEKIVVVSEVELLKLDETQFKLQKEQVIEILSNQIGEIYNKMTEEYIEGEIKRRSRLRSYVNILELHRKVEIYCCLHKSRTKGETIKKQSRNKILNNIPNIAAKDLKNILRAARRIESLVNVADNNWAIVYAFPTIDVNFFKSTTINVNNYESWLYLVEKGDTISEEEGKAIYLVKKQQESRLRKEKLSNIYRQADQNHLLEHLDDIIHWEDDDE